MNRVPTQDMPARDAVTPTRWRGDPALWAILALFFLLSAGWALRVPLPLEGIRQWLCFNPDEGSHIAIVLFTATHHALPTFADGAMALQNPAIPRLSLYYETMHPPVYHLLGALVVAAALPLVGKVHALLLLRLLSCAMGAGVVWLTYRTAILLASRRAALLAAGCVAGVPMFVSLSGAVSNESLAALAAAAAFYLMALGVVRGFPPRRLLALAAWVALGVGSKYTDAALLPAAFLALWVAGRRHGLPSGPRIGQMGLVAGAVALVLGPWLVRNQHLYGVFVTQWVTDRQWDVLQPGYTAAHAQKHISAPHYAFNLAARGWRSFWGEFNGWSRPMPRAVYAALIGLQAVAGVGLWCVWRRNAAPDRAQVAALMAVAGLCVLAIFLDYNWKHYTPQGRYFFPLLVPFGLLTAGGWRAAFPPQWRGMASLALLAGLGLLNVFCLIAYAHP